MMLRVVAVVVVASFPVLVFALALGRVIVLVICLGRGPVCVTLFLKLLLLFW